MPEKIENLNLNLNNVGQNKILSLAPDLDAEIERLISDEKVLIESIEQFRNDDEVARAEVKSKIILKKILNDFLAPFGVGLKTDNPMKELEFMPALRTKLMTVRGKIQAYLFGKTDKEIQEDLENTGNADKPKSENGGTRHRNMDNENRKRETKSWKGDISSGLPPGDE